MNKPVSPDSAVKQLFEDTKEMFSALMRRIDEVCQELMFRMAHQSYKVIKFNNFVLFLKLKLMLCLVSLMLS